MKMKTRVFFLDKVYFSEILQADTIIAESKKYDVNVMRIAEYINDVVGTRKIPNDGKGAVVMKLDVEV